MGFYGVRRATAGFAAQWRRGRNRPAWVLPILFGKANRHQGFPELRAITLIQNYLYFLETSAHTSISKLPEDPGLAPGEHAKSLFHC